MDLQPVLKGILNYFKESAGDQWEAVKKQALEYLYETETRLLIIALESTTGQLSPEYLSDKAKEELTILESQAISLGIISASMTQEVVNTTVQNLLFTVIKFLTDKINEKDANNTNP